MENAMKMMPYAKHNINWEDTLAVEDATTADSLTKGPAIEAFEDALCRFTGAKYCVVVNSGTAALHCALEAIQRSEWQVMLPSLTFVGAANAVVHTRHTPSFVDIDPLTLCIDPESTRRAIAHLKGHVAAIMAMDYAGVPCDYEYLNKIAKFWGIPIIADACHSLGAPGVGNLLADITCFSFHPAKLITTGEGGAMVTNNKEYADRARIFRDHGISTPVDKRTTPNYEVSSWGFNFRMPDINAALGISQLRRAEEFLKERRRVADNYVRLFKGSEKIKPILQPDNSANHLFVVECVGTDVNRDSLYMELRNKGIGVAVHYPLIHKMEEYKQCYMYKYGGQTCNGESLHISEQKQAKILTLPLYPYMLEEDQFRVCDALNQAISHKPHQYMPAFLRNGNSYP